MIKKIIKIFPFIGVILFIYILVDIGVEKIANTFLLMPPIYFVLALSLLIPRFILHSYKWQYLCSKQKMAFPLLYLLKIFLISTFYAIITPAGIGLYSRAYFLKEKSKASWEKCISNSLIDTNLGFIIGVFLALIGSFILFDNFPGIFFILLSFFIFVFTAFIVLMKKERGDRFFRIFLRPFIPNRFREKIDKSVESLYEDLPRFRDLPIPILIETLTWIIAGSQVYILAQAFSIDIPYVTFVLIAIISTIAATLPISIGGLGVREGTLVLLLSAYGVQPETAFAISLGGFIVKTLVPGIIGGSLSLTNKN